MSSTKYTQCMLRRGGSEQVSWIPSRYATLDNILQLKNSAGVWEDGWKVTFVGSETTEEFLPDSHKAIKEHWKNTSGKNPVGHK